MPKGSRRSEPPQQTDRPLHAPPPTRLLPGAELPADASTKVEQLRQSWVTLGTIEEGKYADIIAVQGAVLRYINMLARPDIVAKQGMPHDPD